MALAVQHDPGSRTPSSSPLSSSSPTPALSPALARERLKVVVFDDDPTGSQTLHGCPLLLRWDAASLAAGLRHPSPFLFVLANSRALDPEAARRRIREICAALRPALDQALAEGVIGRCWLVSRGDSTLRGHFPLEVEEIAAAFGPFAATLLVPAFLEGGRTTVDGVHRLAGRPVHESSFAHDRLFAYGTSYLPDWVAEKSGGRIPAAAVARLGLEDLEAGGERLSQHLLALAAGEQGHGPPAGPAGRLVAVDATNPSQLARLGEALRGLPSPEGQRPGGRFLFQSAASLLNALAPLPPQPRDPAALAALRRCDPAGCPHPGLVLVGSHVPLADQQLARLLAEPACADVEVPVARVMRVLEGPLPDQLLASLEQAWLQQLEAAFASGRTPVLHTSRGELVCRHEAERRRLGAALAGAMARLVGRLAPRLGYVISKGGITSQTLLADGLALAGVELQGQVLPGVSLVLAPQGPAAGWGGCPGALGLPVVTVPGNLGEPDTLVRLWQRLEGSSPG